MIGPTLVAGIVLGFTYGLLALTLILLVKTTGVLNFAAAELATLYAFVAYEVHRAVDSRILTIVLTLAVAAAAGLVLFLVVILPRRTTPLFLSLRTLGVFIVVGAVVDREWGPGAPYHFPELIPAGSIHLPGIAVSYVQLVSIGFACVLAILIGLFTQSSRVGLMIRAVAANRSGARMLGVNVVRVDATAWVIASVVAAAVGVLYAQQTVLAPGMTQPVLLAAFAAAQIADMRSMPVALAAGIGLGVIQSISTVYINQPAWSQVIAFGALAIALLYRSAGARRMQGVST